MEYTVSEYIEAKNNKYIEKKPIRIKSMDDYEKLSRILNNEKADVIIDKSMIKAFLDTDLEYIQNANLNFVLEIEDMSKLSIEDLESYQTKIKLNKIRIKEEMAEDSYEEYDDYSIEDYVELKKQVNYILSFTDESQSDLEKFLIIYKIIGESITYDEFMDECGNMNPSVWNDNQNLIRRLIRRNYGLCWLFKNSKTNLKMCRN